MGFFLAHTWIVAMSISPRPIFFEIIFRRLRKISKNYCSIRRVCPAWNNSTFTGRTFMKFYTVIARLTNEHANEFFG